MVKTAIGIGSGNLDLLEILLRGSVVWNQWRIENPDAQINLSSANLSRANLSRANLSSANLSGANLSSANLSRADLSGANLSGANLSSANLSGANLSGANLSSAKLIGAILNRADFSGAYLSSAILSSANLSGAYLISAILSGAYLISANLSSANLSSAYLSSAYLSNAYLSGAKLSDADLSNANLSGANLSGANLNRADLSGAILSSAILSSAILSGAYLSNANLSGADLSGADLNRTDLSSADLSSAILNGAILSGAKLSDADLSNAKLGIINKVKLWSSRFSCIINKLTSSPQTTDQTFKLRIFDHNIDFDDLSQLESALNEFAQISGYEEVTVTKEEFGSFFKDIRYKIARLISDEVQREAIETGQELYRTGKANVLNRLERQGVESSKQLAEATAALLGQVDKFDNVVLQAGKIIVVKVTDENGRSTLCSRTVSSEIQLLLERTPQLIDNPQALYDLLTKNQEQLSPAIKDQKALTEQPEVPT